MTVHVLMPVFNRLELTINIIHCLYSQIVDESINLVIVDDGSTDGTGNYLSEQDGITVLKGDGNLWWRASNWLQLITLPFRLLVFMVFPWLRRTHK